MTEIMTESVALYNPPARCGHVAVAVEDKLYVWGGLTRDLPEIHDGPAKTAFTSVVYVLDRQVFVQLFLKVFFIIPVPGLRETNEW